MLGRYLLQLVVKRELLMARIRRSRNDLSTAQVLVPARVDLTLAKGTIEQIAVPATVQGGSLLEDNTMQVNDAMSKQVVTISPNDSAQSAARLMAELDISILPVESPVGTALALVSDRDILASVVARGRALTTSVYEFMTPVTEVCQPEDELEEISRKMDEMDVSRLVVVDADHHVVGILSRSDAARALSSGAHS